MKSNPPAHRNATADLLKGVAVVFMIQVHIIEQLAREELLHSTIGRVSLFLGGPPAAPVFLAVMGYFAIQSSRTFASHIRRGLSLIGGGLLLNLGLNANLLYSISIGRFDLDPLAYVFGADILPLAGLSILILAVLSSTAGTHPLLLLTAALAVAAAVPLLPDVGAGCAFQYVVSFFWGKQWWSYFPLFPWLSYVLLGAAAGMSSQTHRIYQIPPSRMQAMLIILLSILLIATGPSAICSIIDLPRYYHHGIELMMWITGFLLVWTKLADSIEHLAGATAPLRYLKWLGRNVTAAYVFQWLLIGNIATELYRTQNLLNSCLWFFAILIATSLLIVAFRTVKKSFVSGST